MAQFFKVVKAFQGKDRETGEPSTDQHGNSKWLFQVEGQGPEGWMSVSKKAGSELKEGDYVYGIVDTWPDTGKAKFVRQQVPEGTAYPAKSDAMDRIWSNKPRAAAPQQSSTGVEAKLDYIITLLENGNNFRSDDAPATAPSQASPQSDDDAPIDLEELDY